MMDIITWNINGIRAGRDRKSLKDLMDSLNADVISLQETKVTRDMLDEPTAVVEGYDSYFSFSRKRSGYSGTANYVRHTAGPEKAEEGLTGLLTNPDVDSCVGCYGDMLSFTSAELEALDAEGRCVITQHNVRLRGEVKSVAIINVYVPRSGCREDRHEYKIKFLSALQCRAEALMGHGVHVIIQGDLNLTHRRLDNCDPDSDEDYKRSSSRIWINNMLQETERDRALPRSDGTLAELGIPDLTGGKFSDVYRRLHPDKAEAFTNWNTATDARKANYGRRLDYILADTGLAEFATSCEILADVEGSDHCPVLLRLDAEPLHHQPCPALCSKLMPEFKGKQQKLSSFFSKSGNKHIGGPYEQSIRNGDITVDGSPSKAQNNVFGTNIPSKDTRPVSPVKKSLSLPSSYKAKSSPQKRAGDPTMKGSNTKRSKLKKDGSLSKQISLTSFFSKTNSTPSQLIHKEQSVTMGHGGTRYENKMIADAQTTQASVSSDIRDQLNSKPDLESDRDKISSNISTCSSSCGTSTGAGSSSNLMSSQEAGTTEVTKTVMSSKDSKYPSKVSLSVETNTAKSSSDVGKLSPSVKRSSVVTEVSSSLAWKSLLQGLPPPPLCPGHKEECILKTVKKAGPNRSRQFYTCPRPDGAPGKPEFRCNFFQWLDEWRKKKR